MICIPIYTEDISQILYSEDIERMWKNTPYENYRVIISLLWYSGARPSEIMPLQRKNINFGIDSSGRDFFAMKLATKKLQKAVGFVVKERTLTASRPLGSEADLYIESIIRWCVKNKLQLDDYLIVGGRTTRWLNKVMHRLSEPVGHVWSAYHFRHSVFSHMVADGASATTVMHWKGASDISSVRRYIHAMPAYWDTLQNRRGRDLISKTPVYNKVRYDAVATTRPATEEEIKTLPEAEDDPKEEAVE